MKFYILPLYLLLLFSCETNKPVDQPGNNPVEDSLTNKIKTVAKSGSFTGFAVAIVNEKGSLYQKGFGYSDLKTQKPYTETTIQNIGSVSKTFIGIALLQAQELGLLKLDDPVNKYLPFKVSNPHFPEMEITIRNLATHTSGIADNEFYLTQNYYLKENQDLAGVKLVFDETQSFIPAGKAVSMNEFLKNMLAKDGKWSKGSYLENKPGKRYEYSNVGATLAAFVIENVSGETFAEFTSKHILKPLKMNASGWNFKEVDFSKHSRLYEKPGMVLPFYSLVSYPDGNFITSINDLSLYLSELIRGYNGKGTLLSKESYREYYKQQLQAKNFVERERNNPYDESYNVGIFMGFGYTGYIGHTGGDPGVASMMFFNPETNIGRILIVNTAISDKKGMKTFFGIWDMLEKYQMKL